MSISVFFNNFTTADVTSALSGYSLALPMYHPLKTIYFIIKYIFSDINFKKEQNEAKRTKDHQ